MVALETQVALAQALVSKAKALGFRPVIAVRDAYSSVTCRPEQLDRLLSAYRPNDLVTLETLITMGRSKVRVV